MKKLGEIGEMYSRHPLDGGLIPYDPLLGVQEAIIIMTTAQRRDENGGRRHD